MTRKEQIMDAAMFFAKKNKNNPSPYLDFVEAAEWADRTMIDKACEWMELRLVGTIGSEDAYEFLTKFSKAMKE